MSAAPFQFLLFHQSLLGHICLNREIIISLWAKTISTSHSKELKHRRMTKYLKNRPIRTAELKEEWNRGILSNKVRIIAWITEARQALSKIHFLVSSLLKENKLLTNRHSWKNICRNKFILRLQTCKYHYRKTKNRVGIRRK